MIEARLSKASLFRKLIDSIRDVVPEVNFDCSSSGISMQAMDSSHVALTSMLLRASGLEHYRCDRSHSFGVSLSSLAKLLKSVGNDPISLKKDEAQDTLNINFKSAETGKVVDYDMKVMDIDSEHLSIPETDYEVTLHMPSVELQRICRDLTLLTDSVTIVIDKDEINFKASGNFASGGIKLTSNSKIDGSPMQVKIEATRPVSLCLSLSYLNNFTKATPLSEIVTICVSEEQPILLEYVIDSIGYVRYYLAPKIGS